MLSRITRIELVRMMNLMFFSPLVYALAAWLLSRYPLKTRVDLDLMIVLSLGASVGLLLLSRPLRWLLLPPGCEITSAKIVLACMILATIGEAIALAGAVTVWFGARLVAYIPFLIISGLYYFDFRAFRFPAIISLWPEE